MKRFFAAFAALVLVSSAAHADNITLDQWYTGSFTSNGTPLVANPYSLGYDGPLAGGGTGTAIAAPGDSNGYLYAVITVGPGGALLTVTDVEDSGDQFAMLVNGVAATLAAPNPLLSPAGGQSYNGVADDGNTYSGLTSLPNLGVAYSAEDIGASLSNSAFSSGTFYLAPGVDVITGTFVGVVGFGDMDFIVTTSSTPEPTSLALFGIGIAGLAGYRWKRRKVAAA